MLEHTSKGIRTAVSTFRNDTNWIKRRERWHTDFNLYRMKPYDAGTGYYSYTSNAARTLAEKIVSMLTTAQLMIRVPTDEATEEERRIASALERLIYGSLGANDATLIRQHLPSLIEQIAWYSCMRGSIVLRILVYKGGENQTIVEVTPWDIYNTVYVDGEDGVDYAIYTQLLPVAVAKKRYPDAGITSAKGTIEVYDAWDGEKNSVMVGNKMVKIAEPHGANGCPVYIFEAGAMPPVQQANYQYAETHRGESLFSSIRMMMPLLNKSISDLLTIARRGVKPPMGFWSLDGQKTLDEDIWQVEKGSTISLVKGVDEIKPIMQPTSQGEASALIEFMLGEYQRGGLPFTSWGQLGFRLSGFAISQLNQAIETIVLPHIAGMTHAYEVICQVITERFAGSDLPPVSVRGRTSKNVPFGYPIANKIKPSDVKKGWLPEVTLKPILPRDDAQQHQLALVAKKLGIVSDETIQDHYLGIQDTDLETRKIDREFANNMPLIRLIKMFEAHQAEGRMDLAQYDMIMIQKLILDLSKTMEPLPNQQAVQQPSQLDMFAAGTLGGGMPPTDMGGISPETMPSEAVGGVPGGAMAGRTGGY